MTEADWLVCTDPVSMMEIVQGKAGDRRLRLVGCAFLRLVWTWLQEDPPSALEVAEMFADEGTTKAALRRARQKVRAERYALRAAEAGMRPRWAAFWLSEVVASENAYAAVIAEMNRLSDMLVLEENELIAVCHLLRDVFGCPFRTVSLDPAWLAWNGGTVGQLAQPIYDERAFDRLPILADALEDAGCDNADILDHCRQPGPHVRGCWVVDLLTGRS